MGSVVNRIWIEIFDWLMLFIVQPILCAVYLGIALSIRIRPPKRNEYDELKLRYVEACRSRKKNPIGP